MTIRNTRWAVRPRELWAAVLLALASAGAAGLAVTQADPASPDASTERLTPAETPPVASPAAEDQKATPDPSASDNRDRPRKPTPLSSGLIGGPHDFTGDGRVGRDLCMPCHTPHLVDAPAPALDERDEVPPPLQPWEQGAVTLDGWSLMCLGCHDGVTAPDVFTSAHAVTQLPRSVRRGGDIHKLPGHPVGTLYPVSAEDYHSRAAVEQAGLPLPEGRIQCVTCHDPHNTGRHAGLLQVSNDRSRLCLTCHDL